MSQQQLATTAAKPSPLAVMAQRFNSDPAKLLDTLKGTVFSAARNNEELMALVIVANEYKLNPLTKEIYAFPAKGGGIVPVISIDGWANLANSHPQMDGMEFEWEHAGERLISCTCVIHRKDRAHAIRVTEYLSECKRQTEPWKMEHRMLRHKALSQCVRIAFGFSGIYDEDEGREISLPRDVTPPASASALLQASASLRATDDAIASEMVRAPLSYLYRKLENCNLTESQLRASTDRDQLTNAGEPITEEQAETILHNWDNIVADVKGGMGE